MSINYATAIDRPIYATCEKGGKEGMKNRGF